MAHANSQAFVRPYNPTTDLENTIDVFKGTVDASVQAEAVCTLGSYIWCRPYLVLEPRSCFVVDDGQGKAVGYIIGTPDTAGFIRRWTTDFIPTFEQNLRDLPFPNDLEPNERDRLDSKRTSMLDGIYNNPTNLVYEGYGDQLREYPGHLHIDILPSHQRLGLGKKLVDTFLEALRKQGCKAVYLGMVADNAGAARFYEREGFKRSPHVLDEGVSGEQGRTKGHDGGGDTIYYVKDL